jgi:hypothetical protein
VIVLIQLVSSQRFVGFPDRPISAVETIRRIGEKFEHLMDDTLSFVL